MSLAFIMAEFGKERRNAGGQCIQKYRRLDPAYTEWKKFFPKADFVVYTDFDIDVSGRDAKVMKVPSPFDISRRRYGWEANDYYKVRGLLESPADISVAIDSDIVPVSRDVEWLPKIIQKFGVVAPLNPRMIVRVDNQIGGGGGQKLECDCGLVTNSVPLGFNHYNMNARGFLQRALEIVKETQARLPVALYTATWEVQTQPFVLPPQWCVCQEHVNLRHKIVLHVGHPLIHEIYEREYGGFKAERN